MPGHYANTTDWQANRLHSWINKYLAKYLCKRKFSAPHSHSLTHTLAITHAVSVLSPNVAGEFLEVQMQVQRVAIRSEAIRDFLQFLVVDNLKSELTLRNLSNLKRVSKQTEN